MVALVRATMFMLPLASLFFAQSHASAAQDHVTAAEVSCLDTTMRALNKKLGSRPLNERDFTEASLADQYSIFLYGQMCVHPPMTDAAELLARNGEKAIPLLKTKMLEPGNEFIVPELIAVFFYMNISDYYDVNADKDLMAFLENFVARMENKELQEGAKIFMEPIIANRKKKAR